MDDILQWLTNGKDYQTGIALLEKHQRNRMLVQHFRYSTPNFAAAKLEYELRKLLKGKVAAAVKYKKIAFYKVIFYYLCKLKKQAI
jgi:hypothetical protein